MSGERHSHTQDRGAILADACGLRVPGTGLLIDDLALLLICP